MCYLWRRHLHAPGRHMARRDDADTGTSSCLHNYAELQFSHLWTQFTGSKYSKFENSMMNAANAMNFVPMLSVPLIGSRMRALQMDSVNGAPQKCAHMRRSCRCSSPSFSRLFGLAHLSQTRKLWEILHSKWRTKPSERSFRLYAS